MLRPLRIESPGAIYHITSRDDRREPIFVDDEDQCSMFVVVKHAMVRFSTPKCWLLTDEQPLHLVLETMYGNLA